MLIESLKSQVNSDLDLEVRKLRNNFAFNKFINNRIDNSKETFNSIIGENGFLNQEFIKNNIQTHQDIDGSIITKQYATVPFIFVQSENITRPDGTKIFINYYPSNEEKPSKIVEYSPKSMITKTTLYDIQGNKKTEERVIRYPDGTSVNELIDFKFNRKTRKTFNIKNIAIQVESFVNDNLIYKLICDDNGNLKKEFMYYNFAQKPILHKEINYHSTIAYTEKEYTYTGELYSVVTKKLDKKVC